MVELIDLWLPIVVSGVVVHILSTLAWMVLPHHKGDWGKCADEDGFMNSVRDLNIAPGNYMFPYHQCKDEMNSPEFQKKWEEGPKGTIILFDTVNMGKNIVCTISFFFVASFCLAYLSTMALTRESDFMEVFRFVGTAGILTYCAAGIPNSIWFKNKIGMNILDGIAYALATAAIFGGLWPST